MSDESNTEPQGAPDGQAPSGAIGPQPPETEAAEAAEIGAGETEAAAAAEIEAAEAAEIEAAEIEAADGVLPSDFDVDPFKLAIADYAEFDPLVREEITRVTEERDDYLAALQRLQADFDNFRKRADRQLAETRERASEGLLKKLLPVLDALDLAVEHADTATAEGATKSLAQIGSLLRDTVEREGLERIDAVNVPFDPTVHDAVMHEPEADPAPEAQIPAEAAAGATAAAGAVTQGGTATDPKAAKLAAAALAAAKAKALSQAPPPPGPTVSGVMRAGYILKGKVVRPAMVSVRG